ncbi:MAG: TatD family hydrolase [Oscillospiraceae bacterium]|nr:TatD family hydrolase [Oscillospiraceae bacterium]
MGIFDTHAHYYKEDFGEELSGLLADLPSRNVSRVLAVGCDLASSEEEIALAARYDYIYAAVGIHPEHAAEVPENWESELERLLKRDKVIALGEIGLDYHYPDGAPHDVQRGVFVKQLEIAKRLDKPVIIHSRDAMGDTLEILKEYKPRGVMHCFSGSAETAREIVKLGMYVGFTGVLTFKNSKKARAACEAVPTDRLLLETDCPYMAPVPHRGERCDSSMIAFTAAAMAGIKGVSAEEMVEIARMNGERLFFGTENFDEQI